MNECPVVKKRKEFVENHCLQMIDLEMKKTGKTLEQAASILANNNLTVEDMKAYYAKIATQVKY